jgi:hypothetical protein
MRSINVPPTIAIRSFGPISGWSAEAGNVDAIAMQANTKTTIAIGWNKKLNRGMGEFSALVLKLLMPEYTKQN